MPGHATIRGLRARFCAASLIAILAAAPGAALAADHRHAPAAPMGNMPAGTVGPMEPMAPPPGMAPMGTMAPGDMRSSEATLVRTLLPAVVNISSRQLEPTPRGEPQRILTLSGSGFIVEPSGVIATNYHVVGGAYEIIVTFWDGSRARAHLIAATKVGDIAVLRVDVGHKLPVVKWTNSETVQIGDPVLAIGNPLGIGMSVTSGIVSALNRDIMASPYDDFIQTDASINHGNSGGPLFNMSGRVIGIDTAIYSPTTGSVGIGFAIPANDAQFVIGRLLKYGEVKPGWIGVSLQQVTPDIAEALGMERPDGSILSDVQPGSPAAKAGLRVGDVIMRVAGKPARDTRAVMRDIAVVPAGSAVAVGLWRGGKADNVSVTVQEWPQSVRIEQPAAPASLDGSVPRDSGLQMTAFDNEAREKYGLDFDEPGLLITGVGANTDAAERGLIAGDVILRVEGKSIQTPQMFRKELESARAAKHRLVLVLVQPKLQTEPVQAAGMPGKTTPMDQKHMMMGLQWGPPKWVALQLGNR